MSRVDVDGKEISEVFSLCTTVSFGGGGTYLLQIKAPEQRSPLQPGHSPASKQSKLLGVEKLLGPEVLVLMQGLSCKVYLQIPSPCRAWCIWVSGVAVQVSPHWRAGTSPGEVPGTQHPLDGNNTPSKVM